MMVVVVVVVVVERGIVSSFQYWKEGRAYLDALLSK
jgi:hypothetical protein